MTQIHFGVAFRLLAGLAAMAVLSMAATAIAVVLVGRVSDSYQELANEQFPVALVATELGRQSEAVAKMVATVVPSLMKARTQDQRESIIAGIKEQVDLLEGLVNRLSGARVDPEKLKAILAAKEELISNIGRLNEGVEHRINAAQVTEQALGEILRLQTGIANRRNDQRNGLTDRAEEALQQWAMASERAVGLLLTSLAETDEERLKVSASRFAALAEDGKAALPLLPDRVRKRLLSVQSELERLGTGADSLFENRLSQRHWSEAVDETLDRHRTLSDDFVQALTGLITGMQNEVRAQSRELEKLTSDQSRILILISVFSALSALGVFLYFDRSVVRRLVALRGAMRAHVAGRRVEVDHSGRDEISDMAQSLTFFVDTIEKRAVELGKARDMAEGAREAAETANKAKSSFLATMSHEIRTPMNGVMTMAEMLGQTSLSEEQKGMSEVIRDSAAALLTIINDILDFSKIEAGKLDLEQVELSLTEIMEGVADLLAVRAEEKGIELVTLISPDLPDRLRGDPVRLRQILLNLVGNAVKFTEKGQVTLEVCPAEFAPEQAGIPPLPDKATAQGTAQGMGQAGAGEEAGGQHWLYFSIQDTGIGMDEDQRARLFQPFVQADSSTARRFGGTGLGLSICMRLVEMMGGQIGVQSWPGEGSLFWFRIPLSSIHSLNGEPEGPDLTGLRVIVATPNYDIGRAAGLYLRYAGADVHLLAGDEGLAELLAGPEDKTDAPENSAAEAPPVLVIDQNMGRQSGRILLQKLELHRGLAPFSALLLLPRRLYASGLEDRPASLSACLAKPLRRQALLRQVASAAGRSLQDLPHFESSHAWSGTEYRAPSREDAEALNAVILAAEDNPTNQLVLHKLAERLGFVLDMVENGEDALEKMQQNSYGLLLTDCHMPVMDGYSLTRAIRGREQQQGGHLPIVALTADALPGTARNCRDTGMDDFLSKPIDIGKFESVVGEYVPEAFILRQPRDSHAGGRPVPGASFSSSVPMAGLAAGTGQAENDQSGFALTDLDVRPSPAPVLPPLVPGSDVAAVVAGMTRKPQPPIPPEILDLEFVEQTFGDLEVGKEMLLFFLETTAPIINALPGCLEAGDQEDARATAHSAAGAARTAGANVLAASCKEFERAAHDGDLDQCRDLLPRIRQEFGQVDDFIRNHMGGPGQS